jgi:hypothetical protein
VNEGDRHGKDFAELTKPMSEPFPDVIQDLWQLSHLTPSYLARARAGGIILGTGIVENNAVAIVVAALFLPFLAEVLAVSFGLWSRDGRLIPRGLYAIAVSIPGLQSPPFQLRPLGRDRHYSRPV